MATGATAEGLRERKKRETRAAISASATALFARQGFEATTISDVARDAGVAKMTVTNYFALKEDLVFDRRAEIVARLAAAVRDREDGRSVLDAIRSALEQGLDERNPTFGFIGPRFAELVLASPALLASERSMFDAQEQALATELSAGPGDVEMELAAAALAALFRILYYEGRRRMLAGEATDDTVGALRLLGRRGFDRLAGALPPALVARTTTAPQPPSGPRR
jgi:AcrR family transcriptional regulator